jgi:hypothetical protein
VYRVSVSEKGVGIAEKIDPTNPTKVLGYLDGGPLVGVGVDGIVMYGDEQNPLSQPNEAPGRRPRRSDEVNSAFHQGHTTNILGLFLVQEEAVGFSLGQNSRGQLEVTKETLHAIGDHHPIFIISQGPQSGFPPEFLEA